MSTSLRIASCNLQAGIGTAHGYWHYLVTGFTAEACIVSITRALQTPWIPDGGRRFNTTDSASGGCLYKR